MKPLFCVFCASVTVHEFCFAKDFNGSYIKIRESRLDLVPGAWFTLADNLLWKAPEGRIKESDPAESLSRSKKGGIL